MSRSHQFLLIVIILAFLVRLVHLEFPAFTSEEARIAYRGYTLATTGKDELGRNYPWLFNSLEDYQLPVTSYVTALGIFMFGKSDFAARFLFIIIGTFLVFLIYKISKIFTAKPYLWFLASLSAALSPPLIFLSKTPNETIILVFLFTLLFYLLVKSKLGTKNFLIATLIMVTIILTSKYAWFILIPFTSFTLFLYQKKIPGKTKVSLIAISIFITFLVFISFIKVPQSGRSLAENNINLVSNITLKNGIDKLRGQGIQKEWPPILSKILFNKFQFLVVGLTHGISNLQPSFYFGQFDSSGKVNFIGLGAWLKIFIIPTILGLIFLVTRGDLKQKLSLIYFPLLTWPSILIYPDFSPKLLILTLPFTAIVIALGLSLLNKKIVFLIFLIGFVELLLSLLYLQPQKRNTNDLRPGWIEALATSVYQSSQQFDTAVSDDVVQDIIPFIEWYNLVNPQDGFFEAGWPYKFRQSSLKNIRIIGSEDTFRGCMQGEKMAIFVSGRDLNKIQNLYSPAVAKSYQDELGKDRGYFFSEQICID